MSRLFLKKLIVILTAVTVQGLVLNVSSLVLAQEDAVAEVEAQLEAALVEAEELEDDDDDAPDVGGMVANWGTTKAKILVQKSSCSNKHLRSRSSKRLRSASLTSGS